MRRTADHLGHLVITVASFHFILLSCHSSLDEEANVSSTPRESQPKRDVGTDEKGAKRPKRSASNKSSYYEPDSDEENQKVK